jgi:hypothetical protein
MLMPNSDRKSSRRQLRCQRTVVLDAQWPHFKRTLSKEPGGLGAGIPGKAAGSRKSAFAKPALRSAKQAREAEATADKQGTGKRMFRG